MDDQQRAALLGELATRAGMERKSFLDEAAEQFIGFIDDNRERFGELGGLVLIDDDPEYLALTPEGTFTSRSRFQDDGGEWVTEDEDIESGAELVEIYNPADLYAAFAEAARDEAGLDSEPTAAEDLLQAADIAPATAVEQDGEGEDSDVELPEDVADSLDDEPDLDDIIDAVPTPTTQTEAARVLYDLALTFQVESQRSEAQLLEDFEDAAAKVTAVYGDHMIADEEVERVYIKASGAFEAEVVPESDEDDDEEAEWRSLTTPEDMVQFYDPTDLFADLAEAVAEAHPEVAPEFGEDDGSASGADDAADDASRANQLSDSAAPNELSDDSR